MPDQSRSLHQRLADAANFADAALEAELRRDNTIMDAWLGDDPNTIGGGVLRPIAEVGYFPAKFIGGAEVHAAKGVLDVAKAGVIEVKLAADYLRGNSDGVQRDLNALGQDRSDLAQDGSNLGHDAKIGAQVVVYSVVPELQILQAADSCANAGADPSLRSTVECLINVASIGVASRGPKGEGTNPGRATEGTATTEPSSVPEPLAKSDTPVDADVPPDRVTLDIDKIPEDPGSNNTPSLDSPGDDSKPDPSDDASVSGESDSKAASDSTATDNEKNLTPLNDPSTPTQGDPGSATNDPVAQILESAGKTDRDFPATKPGPDQVCAMPEPADAPPAQPIEEGVPEPAQPDAAVGGQQDLEKPGTKINLDADRNTADEGVNNVQDDPPSSTTDEIKSGSTFEPQGVSPEDADAYLKTDEGRVYLQSVAKSASPGTSDQAILDRATRHIMSGQTIPVPQQITQPLLKIVPKGQSVSGYTPFFTTQEGLEAAARSGRPLHDVFGLPANSKAETYDVYIIVPNANATVYQSAIAPTSELAGRLTTNGGGEQILVPDRSQFSTPQHVGQIDNIRTE